MENVIHITINTKMFFKSPIDNSSICYEGVNIRHCISRNYILLKLTTYGVHIFSKSYTLKRIHDLVPMVIDF